MMNIFCIVFIVVIAVCQTIMAETETLNTSATITNIHGEEATNNKDAEVKFERVKKSYEHGGSYGHAEEKKGYGKHKEIKGYGHHEESKGYGHHENKKVYGHKSEYGSAKPVYGHSNKKAYGGNRANAYGAEKFVATSYGHSAPIPAYHLAPEEYDHSDSEEYDHSAPEYHQSAPEYHQPAPEYEYHEAPVHVAPAHSYSYPSPAPTIQCPLSLLISCEPTVVHAPCVQSMPSYVGQARGY
jgi:hypothetical protein